MKRAKSTNSRLLSVMHEVSQRRPLEDAAVNKALAIVSTPRSGSSLLSDRIIQTERLGNPREWVNPRHMNAYASVKKMKAVDIHEYLSDIKVRSASSNGVFAIKMHVSQYKALRDQKFDMFSYLRFDHVVFVRRRDKLAQALSLRKAQVTDYWNSKVEKPRNYDAVVAKIRDSDIVRCLYEIIAQEEYAENHLREHITSTAFYEDFRLDHGERAILDLAQSLGVDIGADDVSEPTLSRQSNHSDGVALARLKATLGC